MQISVHSNIGKKRTSNQDYTDYFTNDYNQTLFVLCDGVGGHQAGDVASELATHYIGEYFKELKESLTLESVEEWLESMIDATNQYIYDLSLSQENYYGMGTTLVMAIIVEDQLIVAHVGDSRAYIYRNHELILLTEDHSLVNVLVNSGEITQDEARNHPRRNVVTQSIGITETVQPEISVIELDDVVAIMLCSDGLSDMVSDQVMEELFQTTDSIDELGEALVKAANDAGGLDNITIIIVSEIQDEGLDERGDD